MVSRIHFYCPGCGAEEVPVLITTPYYNCPDCQTITPRDKMDRKRRNNYLLAGVVSGGMTASIVGSGSFFDATQATASLSVTNCIFQQGDVAVVCVADNVAGGSSGPATLTVGGLAFAVANALPTTQGDQTGTMGYRQNITSGAKTVVVGGFGVNPTACAAIVLAVRGARLSSVSGAEGVGAGSGTSISATIANTAGAVGIAISTVAHQNTDLIGNTVFADGFTRLGRAGTHQGGPPNDTCVDVAFKQVSGTADIVSTGTIAVSSDWVLNGMAIRPL